VAAPQPRSPAPRLAAQADAADYSERREWAAARGEEADAKAPHAPAGSIQDRHASPSLHANGAPAKGAAGWGGGGAGGWRRGGALSLGVAERSWEGATHVALVTSQLVVTVAAIMCVPPTRTRAHLRSRRERLPLLREQRPHPAGTLCSSGSWSARSRSSSPRRASTSTSPSR
jgi:hypothetical protein